MPNQEEIASIMPPAMEMSYEIVKQFLAEDMANGKITAVEVGRQMAEIAGIMSSAEKTYHPGILSIVYFIKCANTMIDLRDAAMDIVASHDVLKQAMDMIKKERDSRKQEES